MVSKILTWRNYKIIQLDSGRGKHRQKQAGAACWSIGAWKRSLGRMEIFLLNTPLFRSSLYPASFPSLGESPGSALLDHYAQITILRSPFLDHYCWWTLPWAHCFSPRTQLSDSSPESLAEGKRISGRLQHLPRPSLSKVSWIGLLSSKASQFESLLVRMPSRPKVSWIESLLDRKLVGFPEGSKIKIRWIINI